MYVLHKYLCMYVYMYYIYMYFKLVVYLGIVLVRHGHDLVISPHCL